MNNENKKPILEIIILLLIIIPLIAVSFICSEDKFEITKPIVVLACLLVVVLLSSRFDNFQIGKLFTLSKNIKEYKEKNEKLEDEKNELIKQLINFNIQSQHTSNMNFNGISLKDLKESISIEKASEEEIKNNKVEEVKESIKNKEELKEHYLRFNKKKLEAILIKKCFGTINYGSIVTDIKVNTNIFNGIDPISDRIVIFDAFYNDKDMERFIEVTYRISPFLFDRLYVMLNKIYHYRRIKNSNCNLTLIVAKMTEDSTRTSWYTVDKLKEMFLPAISSGLLNILEVEVTEEEMNEASDKI